MIATTALVLLKDRVVPDRNQWARWLEAAGLPVQLETGEPEGGLVVRWLTEDGLHRLSLVLEAADGTDVQMVSPRVANREAVEEAVWRWRLTLQVEDAKRLPLDLTLLGVVGATVPNVAAVAVRIAPCATWHAAEDLAYLLGDGPEPEWPGELLVDLMPGPLGPDSLAVLSDGLERYGMTEVMVVADRASLAEAWSLALELLDDRMLDAAPSADLQRGPHPTRPLAWVDVAFVDGGEDDSSASGGE
ncbi:MAG: hypothetical protein AB8H79_02280 [Myxococcota bacterium]